MINLRITGLERAQSGLKTLASDRLRAGVRRAVRTAIKSTRTRALELAGQRYTLSQSKFSRAIKTRVNGINGEVYASGAKIPLKNFFLRPNKRLKRAPVGGLFAMNVKGQGGYLKRGFLTHNGRVFERISSARYPIKVLKGPSVPGMLNSPAMRPKIEKYLGETAQQRLLAALAGVI